MAVLRRMIGGLLLCALLSAPLAAQPTAVPEPAPPEAPIEAAQSPARVALAEDGSAADGTVAPGTDVPTALPAAEADDGTGGRNLAAFVDGVVTTLQREHGLAALTVSVVDDDALVLARGYGMADAASASPVTPDTTLFRIGSVSKTFTWTAVMMLVERGQLDLDADVNSYLASVRIAEAFGVPVTLRQLMHHRAGFEDSLRLFAIADDDPRTLAELLQAQQPARVYAPGLRTSYSNWGSALAAQIVADVSGETYADFLRREILEPLGMHATTFVAPSKLDAAQRDNLATGYKEDRGALALQGYMQIGAYWPAGGIASTATDMARWMRFHLNGGELEGTRLMSAQTHAAMWTRGYDDRPGAADLAHGFQDRSYRGLRQLGHGGATAAFFTNMVLVPERSLGIFVSQSSTQSRLPVSQLPDQIVDHLEGVRYHSVLADAAAEPGALAELAGTYLQNRRVFSSFAAVFGLGSTGKVAPVSADTLLVTLGEKPMQYRRVGKERDLFEAADGTRIAFVREGDRVVALADGSGVHTLEKVGVLDHPHAALGSVGAAVLLALTTLLGFWWRLGRGPAHGQGAAAGLAASASLLAALSLLAFAVAVALLLLEMSKFDLARMAATYPPQSMHYAYYAAWVVAAAAGALVLALLPAWRANGWGLWRRLHFSVFALVLALAAYQLWQWRVFGAPVH